MEREKGSLPLLVFDRRGGSKALGQEVEWNKENARSGNGTRAAWRAAQRTKQTKEIRRKDRSMMELKKLMGQPWRRGKKRKEEERVRWTGEEERSRRPTSEKHD
jgi:hypothetical protein